MSEAISQRKAMTGHMAGRGRVFVASVLTAFAAAGIAIGIALSGGGSTPDLAQGAPLAPDDGSVSTTMPAGDVQLEPGDTLAPTDGEPAVVFSLGGGSSTGAGLSVDEIVNGNFDRPMVVSGFLFVESDVTRLCSMLAESFPPQCAGDSVKVSGLDPSGFLLDESQGVLWSADYIQVLGTMDGDIFVAVPIS
jgi:hypothetical protein